MNFALNVHQFFCKMDVLKFFRNSLEGKMGLFLTLESVPSGLRTNVPCPHNRDK